MPLKVLRNRAEMLRDEIILQEQISAELKQQPRTIRELAQALDKPPHEILCWVMAMRRYGHIEEVPGRADEDGYFHYRLAGKDES